MRGPSESHGSHEWCWRQECKEGGGRREFSGAEWTARKTRGGKMDEWRCVSWASAKGTLNGDPPSHPTPIGRSAFISFSSYLIREFCPRMGYAGLGAQTPRMVWEGFQPLGRPREERQDPGPSPGDLRGTTSPHSLQDRAPGPRPCHTRRTVCDAHAGAGAGSPELRLAQALFPGLSSSFGTPGRVHRTGSGTACRPRQRAWERCPPPEDPGRPGATPGPFPASHLTGVLAVIWSPPSFSSFALSQRSLPLPASPPTQSPPSELGWLPGPAPLSP